MEKGEMRVEANISVAPLGERGTKVEIKNLNSFRIMERAVAYEIKRQSALLERGELTADELLRHYCTRIYALTGSYEESARRLGLDRRTVKAKLDPELLERLRGE